MPKDSLHRLRWRCRRGLLELDLLLGIFLEASYHVISDEEKRAFEALLHHSDPELWQYCLGGDPHPDPVTADVIAKIRRTALS
jgi:antitoxin CptB